jgi:hypothetical protein
LDDGLKTQGKKEAAGYEMLHMNFNLVAISGAKQQENEEYV